MKHVWKESIFNCKLSTTTALILFCQRLRTRGIYAHQEMFKLRLKGGLTKEMSNMCDTCHPGLPVKVYFLPHTLGHK